MNVEDLKNKLIAEDQAFEQGPRVKMVNAIMDMAEKNQGVDEAQIDILLDHFLDAIDEGDYHAFKAIHKRSDNLAWHLRREEHQNGADNQTEQGHLESLASIVGNYWRHGGQLADQKYLVQMIEFLPILSYIYKQEKTLSKDQIKIHFDSKMDFEKHFKSMYQYSLISRSPWADKWELTPKGESVTLLLEDKANG